MMNEINHKLSHIMLALGLLSSSLVATGCAGAAIRDEAVELARLTEELAQKGEQVANAREALAKARTSNIHTLEDSAMLLEMEATRHATVWKLAGFDARLELLEGIHAAVSEEAARLEQRELERTRQEKQLEQAKSATDLRADKLRGAAKKLAQLGKEMTTKQYVEFYLNMAREIETSIANAVCTVSEDEDQTTCR